MRYPGSARMAAAVGALVLVTGCGTDPGAQDLCAQYADVDAAVEEMRSIQVRPENAEAFEASVEDVRLQADKIRDELDQLQRVSEGRHDTAISLARQRATEIRESLASARYDVAQTLVLQITEAQQELEAAYAQLSQSLDTQCSND